MPAQLEKTSSSEMTPKRDRSVEVIMDSNALFVPLQFKIDILDELGRLLNRHFELILLSQVRSEIEMLASERSPKIRKMAAFAMQFAEKCKYVEVPFSAETVDDAIIHVAAKNRTPVFTNDAQLRKKLRDISVPVIYVRQKSHLAIEGMIQSHV